MSQDTRKKINLVNPWDAELGSLSRSLRSFTLTFRGETPGGKGIDLAVTMDMSYVSHLAEKLNAVIRHIDSQSKIMKEMMRGDYGS